MTSLKKFTDPKRSSQQKVVTELLAAFEFFEKLDFIGFFCLPQNGELKLLRFFVCSRACEEAFPPRLWPEAYNDARSSANRSGMDAVRYRKRKSDTFWCA